MLPDQSRSEAACLPLHLSILPPSLVIVNIVVVVRYRSVRYVLILVEINSHINGRKCLSASTKCIHLIANGWGRTCVGWLAWRCEKGVDKTYFNLVEYMISFCNYLFLRSAKIIIFRCARWSQENFREPFLVPGVEQRILSSSESSAIPARTKSRSRKDFRAICCSSSHT